MDHHIEFPGHGKSRPEPSADARGMARNCKDWFTALTQEGFSEPQALHIVGVMISSIIQKGDTR